MALPDGSAIVGGGGGSSGNKDYRLARVQGGLAAQPTQLTVRVNGRGSLIVNAPGTIDRTIDLSIRDSDGAGAQAHASVSPRGIRGGGQR